MKCHREASAKKSCEFVQAPVHDMAISILFRPKNRVQGKIFRTFRETSSNFSPSQNFFRWPKFFSKFCWQRCDSFGPKIVKIGAILTVFQPFEISRKFVPYKFLQNFLCGYKIEMATWFPLSVQTAFSLPPSAWVIFRRHDWSQG